MLGSISMLKKKFRVFLNDNDKLNLKMNEAPQQLTHCLILIAEKLLLKCVEKEQPEKNNEGVYNVKEQILRIILYDYVFFEKYNKQYNRLVNYTPFVLMAPIYAAFEEKHGNKLFICKETKNLLNYILCCIQNETILLSCEILNYAKRKTFTADLIVLSLTQIIQNDEIMGLIKLKLDCSIMNGDETEKNEETEKGDDEKETVDNGTTV